VIVKSVNRIFFRSSVNQGLILIEHRQAVESFRAGDPVSIELQKGIILVNNIEYPFEPLPDKLMDIISKNGLVNWILND